MTVAIFCFVLLAQSVVAQVPKPMQGANPVRRPAEQTEIGAYPVFEFHSGFWINLHHTLYQQARVREQRPTARPEKQIPAGSEEKKPGGTVAKEPAADEESGWNEAVQYYAAALARRDLLFDGDMVDIKNRLAELETCTELSGKSEYRCASNLRPELIAALERAAPFYRTHGWAEYDRSNRQWIAATEPLVREFGAKLAEHLATVYHAEWPGGKIRVDVCQYAGLVGGYSSLDPLHITIAAGDERNRGIAGLAELFHEASHGLAGSVRDTLVREYRSREKPIPRDLWNAVLFYTTVEFIQRDVAGKASGEDTREGLSDRLGLASRGWQSFQAALVRHWKPYLEALMRGRAGPDDLERALAQVVSSL
jgi:hypothetical protein